MNFNNLKLNIFREKKSLYLLLPYFTAVFLSACELSSAFDVNKDELLRKGEYPEKDIALFNEFYNFRTNTNRCNVDSTDLSVTYKCHAAYFRLLASEGHIAAEVISKFYKPHTGDLHGTAEDFAPLHKLAEQGNKSALCFSEAIMVQIPKDVISEWPFNVLTESKYTRKGAAEGLPICSYMIGLHYLHGSNEFPKNEQIALKYIHQAAISGIYPAQAYLAKYFQERGVNDPDSPLNKIKLEDLTVEDMKKINASHYIPKYQVYDIKDVRVALCWGLLADFHKVGSGTSVADILRMAAEDQKNQILYSEYIRLANSWDIRQKTYQNKSITAEDCITIERG